MVELREHRADDFDAYFEWQSDADVAAFTSWLPRSRADSWAALCDAIGQQRATERTRYFFAVVQPTSQEMVGDVGLTIVAPGVGDCGWFIRRRFWGRGYATAAVGRLTAVAFADLGLGRLTAACDRGNVPSRRVMEKCGFVPTAPPGPRLRYALSADQWRCASEGQSTVGPP